MLFARVLYYPGGSSVASRVYGQNDKFNTNYTNGVDGFVNARTLKKPRGVAVDANGGLYIGDSENNRSDATLNYRL